MATDNPYHYGFRWYKAFHGGAPLPAPVPRFVATAYAGAYNTSGYVDMNVGDLVQEVSDGSVAHATGSAASPSIMTGSPWGVVVGIKKYYDGSVVTGGTKLPRSTTWSNDDQKAEVLVVPITAGIWECICDDKVTAVLKATYEAYIGENVEVAFHYDATTKKAHPRLDISSHATTYTLGFKIVGLSPRVEVVDYAGSYVPLLVVANRHTVAPFYSQATGV
jgi:hypothetical protein